MTLKPCAQPGCPELVSKGRCAAHAKQVDREYKSHSPKSREVYSLPMWRGIRRELLAAHPWCQTPGCNNMATQVDHIVRMEEGGDPWNRSNLQVLCMRCHSSKTMSEVFGRKTPA